MSICSFNTTEPFSEYIKHEIHRCDYDRKLSAWASEANEPDVLVRSYERARAGNGLVADFLSTVNISLDAVPRDDAGWENRSPPDRIIVLIRNLNSLQEMKRCRPVRTMLDGLRSILIHRRYIGVPLAGLLSRLAPENLYEPSDLIELQSRLERMNMKTVPDYLQPGLSSGVPGEA